MNHWNVKGLKKKAEKQRKGERIREEIQTTTKKNKKIKK